MGNRSTWLPTTAYAVLGLLAIGDDHTAYELKQRADRSIAHIYWSPAMSAVYTELQRLEGLELVAHRLEAETDARSKRVYRITEDGRVALRAWIEIGEHERTVVKNTTLLRVLFGQVADRDTLANRVDEHVGWVHQELEELEQALTTADQQPGLPSDDHMPRLVLEAAISSLRAEASAAGLLADRLREPSPLPDGT